MFVRRLGAEMDAREMSANALAGRAKKLGYKIGQTTISNILGGRQDPTLAKVYAICEAIGLPAWFLMTDGVEQRVIAPPIASSQNVLHLPKPDYKIIRTSQARSPNRTAAKRKR